MNGTTHSTTVRELDCQTNGRIEVRLLWNSLTDAVSVSVDDTRDGESFQFDVARNHPTYQEGLEQTDDLRGEAEARRWVKLARVELNPSPSTTRPEQPLQPNHD